MTNDKFQINFKIQIPKLKTFYFLLFTFYFLLISQYLSILISPVYASGQAVIYYNEACTDCLSYVKEYLPSILKEKGVTDLVYKDYLKEKPVRQELNRLTEKWGIPVTLQGASLVFVNDKLAISGHVPENLVREALDTQDKYQGLIIYQPVMHDVAKNYKVWNFSSEIKEYSINMPLAEYLKNFPITHNSQPITTNQALLPLVITSGFLDGLNPCAFAILLFLVAFIFMMKRTRAAVWLYGAVFIVAIYIVYFLIGVGLLSAIHIFSVPHFMARVGAFLVIFLGLINLKDYFLPNSPVSLRIPMMARKNFMKVMYKASLPAIFLLGALVGLCEFPCTGGIYVAIIGLLSVSTTQFAGLFYLLIYNLMFILPLIIILAATNNRIVTEKLTNLQERNEPVMRLAYGLLMILIGISILAFFV